MSVRSGAFLLLGTTIFLGLPMLGWGPTDVGGFFSEPARLAFAVLVVLTNALFVFVAGKVPTEGRSSGQEEKIVYRQRLALALIRMFSLVMLLVAPYCDRRALGVLADSGVVRFAGLYVLGFAWMAWATVILGKQFSLEITIQEGHRLVTEGPYRYIRHPRYFGIVGFAIGYCLVFRSAYGLILVALLTLLFLWRIHDEEEMLHREFGTDWEAYASRSWRLLPLLY